MTGLRAWGWSVVAALALFAAVQPAAAQAQPAHAPATEPAPTSAMGRDAAKPVRAGNPIVGLVIIGGVIAFLVFVAWVFSRAGGDTGSRSNDGTLN